MGFSALRVINDDVTWTQAVGSARIRIKHYGKFPGTWKAWKGRRRTPKIVWAIKKKKEQVPAGESVIMKRRDRRFTRAQPEQTDRPRPYQIRSFRQENRHHAAHGTARRFDAPRRASNWCCQMLAMVR